MDTESIDTAAAEWVIRYYAEAWTEADESVMSSWLAESTFHRVAYLRLEAVWHRTDRLKALGAGIPAGVVPPLGSWRQPPSRRPTIPEQG